jgi:CspA family cold shock protein
MSEDNIATSTNLTGCVKWFNNKAGYGFITVNNGEYLGTDIFVHHSSIDVSNKQYKYLFQGEYVEFNLTPIQHADHKFQASQVKGINGGKLMCETRHEFKVAQNNYKHLNNESTPKPKLYQDRPNKKSPVKNNEYNKEVKDSGWKVMKPKTNNSKVKSQFNETHIKNQ